MDAYRDLSGLTPNELHLLKELRERVVDVLKPYQDDAFLIRWLRARKFDVAAAEGMLRKHMKFYYNLGMDSVEDFVPSKVITEYSGLKCLGLDKSGNGVLLYLTGQIDYKGFSRSTDLEEIGRWIMYEVSKVLSKVPSAGFEDFVPGRRFTIICDFEGMSLRSFLDTTVIRRQVDIVQVHDANLPELLNRCYMINIPSFFYLWFNIIKAAFDPVTANKIRAYRGGCQSELLEEIDEGVLPPSYGGTNTNSDVENWIQMFKKNSEVPRCYYIDDDEKRFVAEYGKCGATIAAGQTHTHDVVIECAGGQIKWCFRTLPNNIKFGVFYLTPVNKSSNGEPIPEQSQPLPRHRDMRVILPLEDVTSQMVTERGQLLCKHVGTYIFRFHNSTSWLRSVRLYYKIDVIEGNDSTDVHS